ncbi:MAG: LD-carboxypeptidase [Candidatus Omnitrophica bacterium]|nr:LD-carboxypeptidase [Candidatus Omnitrophota bacterium]
MSSNQKQIIKPPKLKSGDTIGVVAPASSFDRDNFKQGVKVLRNLGYNVKYERSIFNRCWSQPGHNKQRAYQINRMFYDKDVKAIFCAKAGSGSAEIIPFLDKRVIRKNPKIFIGYSDITFILLYLKRVANMVVFHGPVVADEIYQEMHPLTLEFLNRLLTEPKPLGELKLPQLISFRQGKASGRIVGGNLTMVVEAIGTPFHIITAGCILFLEDINEKIEAIEDYLKRLRRAGFLKKIKGLVFGKVTDPSGREHDMRSLIEKILKGYDIPILYGFPSGHLQLRGGLNVTLPLGVMVTVNADELSLNLDESAVL